MTRCIVCGLNDTTGSRHAAAIASRLARDLNSRAVLVYVREGESQLQRFSPFALGRSRRMYKGLRRTAGEHGFPPGTDPRVEIGRAASTLVAIAGARTPSCLSWAPAARRMSAPPCSGVSPAPL